ncbi:MAG: hypothetical protein KIT31_40370 [Deltaproteobacteria bacterium]|nr:hypothetical protein [Deltaproteobacteria bacterium]
MHRPWIWWLAALAAMWLAFALCAHWEPVVGDGWGHYTWHRQKSVGLAALWDELVWGWKHGNPRPGQILTLLAFTPGPWHVLVTPPALIALFYLLTALVLGRWPSLRRGDDALLFVAIVALAGVCAPQLGPMLFYRPMSGNYTFTLALNLAWLLPYRFHAAAPRGERRWLAPVMVALGLGAGFCNEHTGPAFAAGAVVAIVAFRRRGDRIPAWMIAGVVGFVAGLALLLLAPGQDARYGGLAQEASMLGRIAERGAGGNLRALWRPVLAMWPALPVLALALVARHRARRPALERTDRIALAVIAGAGAAIVLTLLVSPKIGGRLYFAACVLWCAALARWAVAQLSGWYRTAAAVAAGATLGAVLAILVAVYRDAGGVNEARLAALAAGPRGAVVHLERRHAAGSRWFWGEDLDAPNKREEAAAIFGLAGVELRARD